MTHFKTTIGTIGAMAALAAAALAYPSRSKCRRAVLRRTIPIARPGMPVKVRISARRRPLPPRQTAKRVRRARQCIPNIGAPRRMRWRPPKRALALPERRRFNPRSSAPP